MTDQELNLLDTLTGDAFAGRLRGSELLEMIGRIPDLTDEVRSLRRENSRLRKRVNRIQTDLSLMIDPSVSADVKRIVSILIRLEERISGPKTGVGGENR